MQPTVPLVMNELLVNVPLFAVGTGRCGTKFLSKVIDGERGVASCHERDPLLQTFHRYCTWYGLPVDEAGYLAEMRRYVEADLKTHTHSFEASAFLSLSVLPLHRHLGAKFVLLVRRPDEVVASYLSRDWYIHPVVQEDVSAPLGYQHSRKFHHFMGRTIPCGDDFIRWNTLTRVGKLAWYWSTLNRRVLDQFAKLPAEARRVVKVEELDFPRYCELADFFGFETVHTPESFSVIVGRRPNAASKPKPPSQWNVREAAEFEAEVGPLAEEFGYGYHLRQIGTGGEREPQSAPGWRRLRERVSGGSR